jgi:hypothetical protein
VPPTLEQHRQVDAASYHRPDKSMSRKSGVWVRLNGAELPTRDAAISAETARHGVAERLQNPMKTLKTKVYYRKKLRQYSAKIRRVVIYPVLVARPMFHAARIRGARALRWSVSPTRHLSVL